MQRAGFLSRVILMVVFVVRERSMPGTATHMAAKYDAEFLCRNGLDVCIVELVPGEPLPDLKTLKATRERLLCQTK